MDILTYTDVNCGKKIAIKNFFCCTGGIRINTKV